MIAAVVMPLHAHAVRTLQLVPRPEEDALVQAAQAGERRAFDALYHRHVQSVFARITRMIGPSADREDVVQQVFVELYRALPSFRGEAPFGAFVHGIAARVGYDYLRKNARTVRTRTWSDDDMHGLVAADSPEHAAREREQLRRAFSLLDAIKPKKRAAFVLHVIEGHSLEELSRLLDTDARTLGQRVAHARRELLAALERGAR